MQIINTDVNNIVNQLYSLRYSPEQLIQICELIITVTKGRNNICEDAEIIADNINT